MAGVTNKYQDSEKWLRLVTLIDYAGTVLCKDVLHRKEGLPSDGAQLYHNFLPFKNEMQFNDQKEILCPSNEITDESKFDITMYTGLIRAMFKQKYKSLINDLRAKRNHLYHMANKNLSEKEFEDEWNNVCSMLKKHGFTETVQDLKNDDLLKIEKISRTLDSIKGQIQGSVYMFLFNCFSNIKLTLASIFLKLVL